MSKVSVVLYYWLFIAGVLLIARFLGYSDDNYTIIVTIGIATFVYIVFMLIYSTTQRAARKSQQYEDYKRKKDKEKINIKYEELEKKRAAAKLNKPVQPHKKKKKK